MNWQIPESRRESIRDLLDAALIRAGDRLRLTRPRVGEEHVATVSREGRIVLASGTEYDTPSDAAKAVTGTQVNGWIAWRTDANRTLASLRDQLRDAKTGTAQSATPHQYLSEVSEQLEAGEAVSVTVRELLRHWNARSRGTRITRRIDKDLTSQGLRTFPHFRDVTLDSLVRFSITDAEEVSNPLENSGLNVKTPPPSEDETEDTEPPQIGLKVGNLPSALGGSPP